MPRTDLTEDEKAKIIEALNSDTEPTPELMEKLFPSVAEKFDVAKLDRAKVVTLEYAGKRSEAAILNLVTPTDAGSPLQVERCFAGGTITGESQLDLFMKSKEAGDGDWRNLIVQGDNLQFLKTCCQNADPLIKDKVKGKVKLIYIDPPFATRADFSGKSGEDSYVDKTERAEFIEQLRERIIWMREILAGDASIYLHLDWHIGHYAKIMLDEVFGMSNFMNEIVWKRSLPHNDPKRYGSIHDIIFFYTKGESYKFNQIFTGQSEEYKASHYTLRDPDGRIYRLQSLSATGPGPSRTFGERVIAPPKGTHWRFSQDKIDELLSNGRIIFTKNGTPNYKRYLDESKGSALQSIWVDINPVNSQATERIDYPTQKPEALLERIILASSNPGDLVMDVFAGSGTTAAVAEKLGRRWIVCDFGKHAIYTMQKRMLRIAESKALGKDVKRKMRGRPRLDCSCRPARRWSKKRLRHFDTICRGKSRRMPISLLDKP